MKRSIGFPLAIASLALAASCGTPPGSRQAAIPDGLALIPATGARLPYATLVTLANGTEVRNGGFGSSMCAHPSKPDRFYALTDRGPNIDFTGSAGAGKKFSSPNYTPRIGEFAIEPDGSVSLAREILFKNPSGELISGRPNPKGLGSTGEIPYDEEGNVLPFDPYGLDSEGLAAMPDGTFFVSDEYGPHIVHYSADGRELERISPLGIETSGRRLPAVLARRWANRGMEGLTATPDGKTLVGIMQSTLHNPSKAKAKNLTLTRIVTFDLETGKTAQYLYRQAIDKNANSGIAALSATRFLVIERDGYFSGEKPAMKHLYAIDLAGATDVSGTFESPDGLLLNGKALEECSWDELSAAGIKPVGRELVVDLVATLPNGYPHDKLEGLWVIDPRTVGVINDDDFAVWPDDGTTIQKRLPGTDAVDSNTLYILHLEKPLY